MSSNASAVQTAPSMLICNKANCQKHIVRGTFSRRNDDPSHAIGCSSSAFLTTPLDAQSPATPSERKKASLATIALQTLKSVKDRNFAEQKYKWEAGGPLRTDRPTGTTEIRKLVSSEITRALISVEATLHPTITARMKLIDSWWKVEYYPRRRQ